MSEREEKPPRITPRLRGAPKIRQIYWCDFWNDAQLPEFWKQRPVLIISFKHTLSGHCTILPITSQSQNDPRHAHKLSMRLSSKDSWVVCNHPTTVAISRLSQFGQGCIRVEQEEFDSILNKLWGWLPKPPLA